MSQTANNWHHDLDQIDPFFGDKEELEALCLSAPTPRAAAWLMARIEENERFKAAFFEREAANGDIFNPPLLFQDSKEGQRVVLTRALEDARKIIKNMREQRWFYVLYGAVGGALLATISQYFTSNFPILPLL